MRKGRTPPSGGPAFFAPMARRWAARRRVASGCGVAGAERPSSDGVLGAEDEAGVDPAESERVGEAEGGSELAAIAGDVVEVAVVVAFLEVESGRDPTPFEGEAGDGGLDGAGGTERVRVVGLGAADGDASRAFAEEGLEGHALGGVVEGRGGAVRADEVDLFRADAGALEGRAHGAEGLGAVGPGRGHVVCVVGGGVSQEL